MIKGLEDDLFALFEATFDSKENYLLSVSDYIRRELLEHLIREKIPLEKCYDIIHQVHFLNEQKALLVGTEDKYSMNDTSLALREHDSMGIIPLSTLCKIKSDLFWSLENTTYAGEFGDYFSVLEMLLTISHIPHDGAGRSNEDFLVLYAAIHGKHISFSENGYRGTFNKNSLVHERLRNLRVFQGEINNREIEGLNREEEEISSILKVYNKDLEEIKRRKTSNDQEFINCQLKKRRTSLELLEGLRNPDETLAQIKLIYPESFNAFRKTFTRALNQSYTFTRYH